MGSLFDIMSIIDLLDFNYILSDDLRVITDEGTYNVPLEGNDNVRYLFIDSNEYGKRSKIEVNRIKFLNDVLLILSQIKDYCHDADPNYFPNLYYPPENQHKIEQKLIKGDAPPDGGGGMDGSAVDGDSVQSDVDKLAEGMDDMDI